MNSWPGKHPFDQREHRAEHSEACWSRDHAFCPASRSVRTMLDIAFCGCQCHGGSKGA